MGAGQSGGVEIGGSSMGYQVLRVYPDSPGSRAGLRAYFDFIVAIGQTRFSKEDGSLREILKASVDQKIKMYVFNTRTKQVREVDIVPTTSWGGSGLLGVSIKHSSFDKADERVWHVIEVDPGSPAQQAGFKAGNDYVIGSDSILQENDDLYNLIEAHEGKALKLFVYNIETDNCREVICHPNSKWGGRGYLGCEFGHGLLHRMPYNETPAGGDSKKSSFASNLQTPSIASQLLNDSTPSAQSNNLLQHQATILNRTATQPGQQLFQQALFSNQSPAQASQQIQSPDAAKPVEKPTLPSQPPQAPQTFAQLASAQFQTQQYQQQTAQIQQQQQLLEQQRQQLEEQKRQMELLAANHPSATVSPKPSQASPSPVNSHPYPTDQAPQSLNNYQRQGPPLPPPPPQSQHQQQYTNPSQQSPPPPPPQMSPPPPAPPTQPTNQTSSLPQPPTQYPNQQYVPQTSPYQQYPYGGMQSQFPDQHQTMGSLYGKSSETSGSSLPPSVQTLPPPPPMMYPPPPQAPSGQQQQDADKLPQSQPPPPPFPPQQHQQQPPTMFANQM